MPLDFRFRPRVLSLPGPSCSLAECEATRGNFAIYGGSGTVCGFRSGILDRFLGIRHIPPFVPAPITYFLFFFCGAGIFDCVQRRV
jgi:hypothetical protein